MAPHSSTLAWKIPWTEEPGRLQSMGSWRVRHDWATSLSLFTFMHWRGNGNPLQSSCLENPRDGVAQSRTWLKWFSSNSFIIGDWKTKVGIQEIPGVTGKFGLVLQNETGQRLMKFGQENAQVIANTLFQQHKRRLHMDITKWSILKSDWLYSLQPKMEKLYTISKKKRLGADTGSDHLLLKFRFKLKKVGKTTRPFRHDLNQIPYDYTVEVTNRFKGLDLADKVSEELWMEIRDSLQKAVIKIIPKKIKCKMGKWLSEEALQTVEKRRGAKGKGEKERYTQLNAEFQRRAKR